jgi:hypothetical protein
VYHHYFCSWMLLDPEDHVVDPGGHPCTGLPRMVQASLGDFPLVQGMHKLGPSVTLWILTFHNANYTVLKYLCTMLVFIFCNRSKILVTQTHSWSTGVSYLTDGEACVISGC